MKFLQKKSVMIVVFSLCTVIIGLLAWKLLVRFEIIQLHALAPKRYSRTNSASGMILVFFMPVIATGMLFLGVTRKND